MEWVHIRTTRQYKLSFCIVSQAVFNCLQAKMQLPWIPLHSVFQPDRGRMAEWAGDPLSLSSGQDGVFSSEPVQPSSQDDILQAGAEMEFTSMTSLPFPSPDLFPHWFNPPHQMFTLAPLPSLTAQATLDFAYAESQVTMEQPGDEYSCSLLSCAVDKKCWQWRPGRVCTLGLLGLRASSGCISPRGLAAVKGSLGFCEIWL